MGAILKDDQVIAFSMKGGIPVGPIPKGVGMNRLRWDGTKIIDIAELDELWVRCTNGVFTLHAVQVPNSHKVRMKYRDRKCLCINKGEVKIEKAK